MKTLLTLLTALLFCGTVSAQTFTPKAAFPGRGRWACYSFMLGNKLYTGGGLDTTTTYGDLYAYDAATNTWTHKTNPPFPARAGAVAVVIAGKAYVGFGRDSTFGSGGRIYGPGYSLKDWWQYNDATDTWIQKASLPAEARHNPSLISWNGKGYLLGGNNYQDSSLAHPYIYHSLKEVWEYNPATNAWVRQPDFPGMARSRSFAQVIGDTLFYGLGQEDSLGLYHGDNFRYNLVARTWSAMPAVPAPAGEPAIDGWSHFSVAYGKKVVLMNIDLTVSPGNDFELIYVFNTATNSWTLYPAGNIPGFRAMPIDAQSGSKAYVGLGWNYNTDTYPTDLWEMNLSTFLFIVEKSSPDLEKIFVGSGGHTIYTNIPAGLLNGSAVLLKLYSIDGKELAAYPLTEKNAIDASCFPAGAYSYTVNVRGNVAKAGSVVIY